MLKPESLSSIPLLLSLLILLLGNGLAQDSTLEDWKEVSIDFDEPSGFDNFLTMIRYAEQEGMSQDEFDTLLSLIGCVEDQDAVTVGGCIVKKDLSVHPSDIVPVSEFGLGTGSQSPDESDQRRFSVTRKDGDHLLEIDSNYAVADTSGNLEKQEENSYSFSPKPGSSYWVDVYQEDGDINNAQRIELEVPDFDLERSKIAVPEGEEVKFTIENFEGSGEFDSKNDIGFERLEEPSEELEFSPDAGANMFEEVRAFVQDDTPEDGIKVTKTGRVLVGDGYTRDLNPEFSYSRSDISQEWNVYAGEDADDLNKINYDSQGWKYSNWGPSMESEVTAEGMELKTTTSSPSVIEVRAGLTSDNAYKARFKLWEPSEPATVVLYGENQERAKFETLSGRGFRTFEIEDLGDTYQVNILDDGERVEDKSVNLDSLKSIGFRVDKSDGKADSLFLRYIATKEGSVAQSDGDLEIN